MYYEYVVIVIFLIILSSLQYSLNRIIVHLKEIRELLKRLERGNLE